MTDDQTAVSDGNIVISYDMSESCRLPTSSASAIWSDRLLAFRPTLYDIVHLALTTTISTEALILRRIVITIAAPRTDLVRSVCISVPHLPILEDSSCYAPCGQITTKCAYLEYVP